MSLKGAFYLDILSLLMLAGRKPTAPQSVTKQILAARKGTESADVCVAKTTTKPGSRLICFCHSSVQKKSALILSYNNNITKVLHTFLWSRGMFTK